MCLFRNPKGSLLLLRSLLFLVSATLAAQGFNGYYRYPDVHGDKIVFTAEGDLWLVSTGGGLAQRLTSHPEEETHAVFSPDGATIAFSASYEGPTEVYTMPATGGLPTRWTYEGDPSLVNAWTPDGKVAYQTRAYSRVPDYQVVTIDPVKKVKEVVPLSQASEASYDASGETVYFVRPAFHRNVYAAPSGGGGLRRPLAFQPKCQTAHLEVYPGHPGSHQAHARLRRRQPPPDVA